MVDFHSRICMVIGEKRTKHTKHTDHANNIDERNEKRQNTIVHYYSANSAARPKPNERQGRNPESAAG